MKSTIDSRYVWSTVNGPVDLTADAIALSTQEAGGAEGRLAAPEHVVKAVLAGLGVSVPTGVVIGHDTQTPDLSSLAAPIVLKAWGPGLLHKSDVGAVQLGLSPDHASTAIDDMKQRLSEAGITPRGYLLEQQHPGGTELIVGVVRDPTFGHVVLLGLGGIATELLGLHALRIAPLTEADARDLVTSFPGAPLLTGARGRPSVDIEAIVTALLAIAGSGGLVDRLGDALVEFECNPVVVTPDGVTALDARLILEPAAATEPTQAATTDFTRLFAPRSIAVAGASTNRPGFGNRFLAGYRNIGWTEGLYAVHPTAAEIDGVPAVSSVDDIPGGLDYLLVAVPAPRVPALVAQAAAAGTGFVHVITGGFGEMGPEGARLQAELANAVCDTQTRLIGPNCLGVFAPGGRQTFTLNPPRESGSISVVSQSGGLSGDLVTVGTQRGLRFSKLASVGNAIDVSLGELVGWLVDDSETAVIGLYLEGTRDGAALLQAMRQADGRKPLVILRGGSSEQGSTAVASHTGSMTGGPAVWAAAAAATGVTMVDTLDDLLACLHYLDTHRQAAPAPSAEGVLVIGAGGGASVLATDACDRAGLTLVPLREDLRARLRAMGHGAGTSVANPIELPIGPGTGPALLMDVLEQVLSGDGQAYRDALIHVNVAAYYSYGTGGLQPLLNLLSAIADQRFPCRVAVVTRNIDVASADELSALTNLVHQHQLCVYRTLDEAAIAVGAAQRFDRRRAEHG